MVSQSPTSGRSVDDLDAKIVRCLQLSPRARFSQLADVLDASEQTVARRYRRLVDIGAIQVRAEVPFDLEKRNSWVVRMRCALDGGENVAQQLGARGDARWVALCSGGTEVVSLLLSPEVRGAGGVTALGHAPLPVVPSVLSVAHALVLHRFPPANPSEWAGLHTTLTAAQEDAVRSEEAAGDGEVAFEDGDGALLEALADDGRAPVRALAKASGLSEGRVTRRLAALLSSGAVSLSVDLSASAFGIGSVAVMWLDVVPAYLDKVGRALSDEYEVITVLALSGAWNLVALVACADTSALYSFVAGTLGAHEGIRATDVSPVVRRVAR